MQLKIHTSVVLNCVLAIICFTTDAPDKLQSVWVTDNTFDSPLENINLNSRISGISLGTELSLIQTISITCGTPYNSIKNTQKTFFSYKVREHPIYGCSLYSRPNINLNVD